MKLRTLSALLFAAALSGYSLDAEAKKDKGGDDGGDSAEVTAIEDTGIAAFDDVFGKVKDIQASLTKMSDSLSTAESDLMSALGAAEGTSLGDALKDFAGSAKGMLTVKPNMSSMPPTIDFEVNPEAPQNIQDGANALKGAVTAVKDVITEAQKVVEAAKEIVPAAQALPGKAPAALKEAGLSPKDIMPKVKIVKNNVKATVAVPKQAAGTIQDATGFLKTIAGAFGGE